MRRQIMLIMLGLLLAVSGFQPPAAQAQDPASQIILLVNQLRASRGLSAFQVNGSLSAAAQRHANWMAANNAYVHTETDGSTPQVRANAAGYVGYVSENIVGGTNLSPQQGVIWWENSPIHYATMTSTRGVEIGAGFAGNGSQNMYVIVVGTPTNRPVGTSSSGGTTRQPEIPWIPTPVEVSEPREDGSIVHLVRSGQTAWDIAIAYEVDLSELLKLNRLSSDPIILPGDEILVKPGPQPTPLPTDPQFHTVEEGETLWTLSAIYNVDIGELAYINGLNAPYLISPGDELIIRLGAGQAPPPTPTPQLTHKVQPGQSMWAIAARYGLTMEEINALNPLEPGTAIQPGDEVMIRQPDPTATPTLPVTPTVTATATATTAATASPAATATLPPTLTHTPAITATSAPTLTATPTVTPTPVPAALAPRNSAPLIFLGIAIAMLGLGIIGGMLAIKLVDRLGKRP